MNSNTCGNWCIYSNDSCVARKGGVQLAKSLEKFFTGNSFEQSVDEQKVQFHWFGKKDRIQYLVQFCLERVKDIFTNHSFILKIVSQSQTLALWV